MKGAFLYFGSEKKYIDDVEDEESIGDCFKRHLQHVEDWPSGCFLVCNGKLVSPTDKVQHENIYHICPRLFGGKGGFGSMLRAIGAQIEKTTNREACRDLSGRRMRDVNNEKKLREWVSKAADREKEKEERRKERWARMRAVPKHKFEDPEYHAQKQKVLDNMEESLQVGLSKAARPDEPSTSGTSLGKRKAPPSAAAGSAKRSMDWIGIDLENASDLSSDESDDENSKGSSASGPSTSTSGSENSVPQPDAGKLTASVDSQQKKCDEPGTSVDSGVETPSSSDSKDVQNSVNPDTEKKEELLSTQSHHNKEIPSTSDSLESSKDLNKEGKQSGLLSALAKVPPKDEKEVKDNKKEEVEHKDLDLMDYSSKEELEALGLDPLKADLLARGLKCGGTLTQRAERLWSVRGLTPDQYPANVKTKPAKK